MAASAERDFLNPKQVDGSEARRELFSAIRFVVIGMLFRRWRRWYQ